MSLNRRAFLLTLPLLARASTAAEDRVSPAGARLARGLDAMDVEHRWLPGRSIHWRTGGEDPRGHQSATHCSAFVAAACDRFGVYILRPPEHGQTLLANAQNRWLNADGPRAGWWRVASPAEAQRLANLGTLVVASFCNPSPRRPGHIAIVRPGDVDPARLAEEGPQITQAGAHNFRSIDLRRGFRSHPGAWENRHVEFFAHAVNV